MADRLDRADAAEPVANGKPRGEERWVESWRYRNERDLEQQHGSGHTSDSNSKVQSGRTSPLGSNLVDRKTKAKIRRQELAEREKQRRTDLANAFEELAEFLGKIEPELEEPELANGRKRKKRAPSPEPETISLNRLDLIGRTIDTLRRLYEENIDLKQHAGPAGSKASKGQEEVLVMVPTHSTAAHGGPPRRMPLPPYPPYHQPQQGPLLPHPGPQPPMHPPQSIDQSHAQPPPPPAHNLPQKLPPTPSLPQQQHHQQHLPPLALAASVDYHHASPLPYYSNVGHQYGFSGQPWDNAPNMPHSPLPTRDNTMTLYYPSHHQQTPPQVHYPPQQLNYNRNDRLPPHSLMELSKPMGPAGAPPLGSYGGRWLRPVDDGDPSGTRIMPRPRPHEGGPGGENWGTRPPSRQY